MKYICKQCEADCTKPPLVKTEDAQGSLGTWQCPRCGKGAKVKRVK